MISCAANLAKAILCNHHLYKCKKKRCSCMPEKHRKHSPTWTYTTLVPLIYSNDKRKANKLKCSHIFFLPKIERAVRSLSVSTLSPCLLTTLATTRCVSSTRPVPAIFLKREIFTWSPRKSGRSRFLLLRFPKTSGNTSRFLSYHFYL